MLEESLRRRLEALNRGPLPVEPAAKKRNAAPAIVQSKPIEPLPGLLRTAQVVATASGEHALISLPLERLWPRGERLVAARIEHLQNEAELENFELAQLVRSMPDRALLVDLETCGLAGSALFLIGVLRQVGGQFTIELLLARNYAEERYVLETFWSLVDQSHVLVTFNGKSFDWPMIVDRSARYLLHSGSTPSTCLHVDVLHHARRRWRRDLPDCRLQTLEQRICRRRRMGDIPSRMIPAAYAEFVRTGFERDIESILYHNAVDLVTLLDLAVRLPA